MGSFINWFERSYKVIIVLLVAIMAAAMSVLALQHVASSTAASGAEPRPVPTFGTTAEARVKVSILSDSHAYNAGSWWRQTVEANTIPNVSMGKFDSHPGFDTAALKADVEDSASEGGWVIVQAGTNDLLSARSPEQTLDGLEDLWDGVTAAGGMPIASLLPPSDERPAQTKALNVLIAQEAEARQLPVLDVYTSVASDDGTWADGHSSDGRHADSTASKTMAAAVREQLPRIIVG